MAETPLAAAAMALPIRRRQHLKRVLNGERVGEAALAVGYKTAASGNTAISLTRKKLMEAMDRSGLTDVVLVRDYLVPLLNATGTVTASHEGKITDTMDVADNGVRLAALRETFKLRGSYPKENASPAIGSVSIVWNGPAPAWVRVATQPIERAEGEGGVSTIEGTDPRPRLPAHIHSGEISGDEVDADVPPEPPAL